MLSCPSSIKPEKELSGMRCIIQNAFVGEGLLRQGRAALSVQVEAQGHVGTGGLALVIPPENQRGT